MEEEDQNDESNREAFLDQLVFQIIDRTLDERRAVIHSDNLDAFWQPALETMKFLLHTFDHRQRILAIAHHHDAGHSFAFAIEFDNAAPEGRAFDNPGDMAQLDGGAILCLDHDLFEIKFLIDIA